MTKRKIYPRVNNQHAERTFHDKSEITNNDSIMNMHYLTVQ